jgi:hypothetical protein
MKMNRIYIFYGIAISILGIYALYLEQEHTRRNQMYRLASATLKSCSRILSKHIETTDWAIQKSDAVLTAPESEQKLGQTFQSFNKKFESVLYERHIKPSEIGKIDNRQLDSLLVIYKAMDNLIRSYNKSFGFEEARLLNIQSLLKSGIQPQSNLEQILLDIQFKSPQIALLEEIKNRYKKTLLNPNYGYLPVLRLNKTCLRAGDLIKGEFYLAPYFKFTKNISIEIAGKSTAIVDGVSTYNIVCKDAKNQNIPVEIQLRNPLTNETRAYQKTFSLNACQ